MAVIWTRHGGMTVRDNNIFSKGSSGGGMSIDLKKKAEAERKMAKARAKAKAQAKAKAKVKAEAQAKLEREKENLRRMRELRDTYKQRSIEAKKLRAEAKAKGKKLITPVQQMQFMKTLQKEQKAKIIEMAKQEKRDISSKKKYDSYVKELEQYVKEKKKRESSKDYKDYQKAKQDLYLREQQKLADALDYSKTIKGKISSTLKKSAKKVDEKTLKLFSSADNFLDKKIEKYNKERNKYKKSGDREHWHNANILYTSSVVAERVVETIRGLYGLGKFGAKGIGKVSGASMNALRNPQMILSFVKREIEKTNSPKKAFQRALNVYTSSKIMSAKISRGIIEETKSQVELYKIDPEKYVLRAGTDLLLFAGSGKVLQYTGKISGSAVARLSPKFRKVKTSALGVQKIKNVKKVGDIEIVLQRGGKLKVKPRKAVREAKVEKRLRLKPKLAPTSKVEKEILNVVKKRGDIVTGSYAQESLLKKPFTNKHKDLDILTKNREELIKALKKRFGKKVKFKKRFNSIEVFYNGKVVADLVKYKVGEFGFVKKYGIKRINGLKVAKVEGRLASKVKQLGKIKLGRQIKKRKKVIRDIEKIYGKKGSLKSLKGAYGFTKKQQAKYIGKKTTLTTAQADLLVKKILKKNKKLRLKKWLYATPSDLKRGVAQVRVSRLGLPSKQEASLMEFLSGQASLKSKKPQIFVLPKEKIYKATKRLAKDKPIKTPKGFVVPNFSSELEVVLGKGWIIKRGKKLAQTRMNGKTVKVLELKKVRVPKTIKKDLKSLNQLNKKLITLIKKKPTKKVSPLVLKQKKALIQKIDNKEKLLNKKLKKSTGFDYFSKVRKPKKVYPLGRKVAQTIISKTKYKKKPRTKRISKISRRKKPSKISYPIKVPSRITPISSYPSRAKTPTKKVPSRVSYPSYITKKKVPPTKVIPPRILFRKKLMKKKKPSKVQVFNVYGKSGKKFVKLNTKPLKRDDALAKGTYAIDHTTSKTYKIVPAGKLKKAGGLLKNERNYFNRAGYKLREFKIKKGRKFTLKRKFIEKRRFGIDTRGEKKGLTLAKYMKQQRTGKRKITPTQRKVMLRNLAKARKVRKSKGSKR